MIQPVIRRALPADVAAITEIYNDAILNTTATFDTRPKSIEDRQIWLESHGPRYPVFVAELPDNTSAQSPVVGWSCLTPWSDRPAYSQTVEISFYVGQQFRGAGIGFALLQAAIDEARQQDFHTLIARIADGNAASTCLVRKAGFECAGTLKEVGLKFDQRLDVHLFQLMLGPVG